VVNSPSVDSQASSGTNASSSNAANLSPTTTASRLTSSNGSSSLSGGAIGGIVAGGVVGVLVLVILAFLCCNRRTRAWEGDFEFIAPGARTGLSYGDEIPELKVEEPESKDPTLGAAENKERIII
jgi:hypothetical protein